MKLKNLIATSLIFLSIAPNLANAQKIESGIAKKDAVFFNYVNKYDNTGFIKNPVVWKAIASVVPPDLQKSVLPRLSVQPPIYYYDNFIIASGCKPHSCGSDEAEVWFDIGSKNAIVILLIDGNYSVYTKDYEWETLPLLIKAKLTDYEKLRPQPANIKVFKKDN